MVKSVAIKRQVLVFYGSVWTPITICFRINVKFIIMEDFFCKFEELSLKEIGNKFLFSCLVTTP